MRVNKQGSLEYVMNVSLAFDPLPHQVFLRVPWGCLYKCSEADDGFSLRWVPPGNSLYHNGSSRWPWRTEGAWYSGGNLER